MIKINHQVVRFVATAILIFPAILLTYAHANFNPYTAIPTGSWPEAVAIGDVNGDGLNDVVMTTSYYFDPNSDYKLFVFVQGANGQLQTPIKFPTHGSYTNRPQSVDIGDINGDGRNDVVVGNSRSNIEVFLQDVNGNLTPPLSTYATQNSTVIKIGDLNNDNRLDVAGIGHGTGDATVFFQNIDGSLAAPASFIAPHGGFDDLEIRDINADHKNDLIVMSGQGYAYNNLAVLRQSTPGNFDPVTFYDLGFDVNTNGLGVGDINGDNLNDVVVSYGGNTPSANIGIFYQDVQGLNTSATSFSSYDIPEPVEIKDVTGDGLDDMVVLHGGWNKMGVYVQTPDGDLDPEELHPIPYASHYNAQGLALGDINNDGRADAVIADYNSGLVVLYQESVAPNNPPVADAGPDQNVQLGGEQPLTVFLDGSGSSDPENAQLSFSWSLTPPPGSNAALDNPTLVSPVFTADIAGDYTAQLKVFDGEIYSQIDTVTVTVSAANLPPLANAGPDQKVRQESVVTLDGSLSMDPDGTIVNATWNQIGGPALTLNNANNLTANFTAPKLKGQKSLLLTFELSVIDNTGATSIDRVQVTVIR